MNFRKLHSVLATNGDAAVHLMLPDGEFVPTHFHVTEVGRIDKQFIDCGGTRRSESVCQLQIWVAGDLDHRISASRFASILGLGEPLFHGEDLPVRIEYESSVVSQYPLADVEVTPKGLLLVMGERHTECLAPDRCGIGATECC